MCATPDPSSAQLAAAAVSVAGSSHEDLVVADSGSKRVLDVKHTLRSGMFGYTGPMNLGSSRTLLLLVSLLAAACGQTPADGDGGPSGSGDEGGAYRAAVLGDDPVAYWRFEESSGTAAKDEIDNAHPGTYFGSFTLGADGVGSSRAVGLDGTSACIAVGEYFRFSGSVPFSVEGWVKVTGYGAMGTRLVSTEGFPTGIRSGWNLSASYGDSGYPYFDAWNSDDMPNQWTMGAYSKVSPQDGLLPLNQWSHIVGTYTDTNEVIWVNGVKRDSQNQTNLPMPQKQGVLTIGCASDGDGQIYLGLSGALDEVAIYDKVLTDAQITSHYNLGKPTP